MNVTNNSKVSMPLNLDDSGVGRSKTQKIMDLAVLIFRYIINTVIEIFAILACAVTYPILQTRFDPKECVRTGDPNKDIPIILVHGYLHNSSAWMVHRWLLNNQGYKNVFTVDLGAIPFGKSIEKYAEVLEARVNEIMVKSEIKQVRLIGHSMGGLVTSYYALLKEHNHFTIKDVITLDSPLQGTPLAHICFDQPAKQMRPNHEFNKTLSAEISNTDIRFHHFGSDTDFIVGKKTALNGNPANEIKFKTFDGGHASILFSKKVNSQIVEILDDPEK